VVLSYALSIAPRCPFRVVKNPLSPATTRVLVTSVPIDSRPTRSRNIQPFERRMIPDVVRRLPVGYPPSDLVSIQVNGRDAPVWRLNQRQALNRQRAYGVLRREAQRARGSPRQRFRPSRVYALPFGRRALNEVHIRHSRRRGHQTQSVSDACE
jgi:hypothetical protein